MKQSTPKPVPTPELFKKNPVASTPNGQPTGTWISATLLDSDDDELPSESDFDDLEEELDDEDANSMSPSIRTVARQKGVAWYKLAPACKALVDKRLKTERNLTRKMCAKLMKVSV